VTIPVEIREQLGLLPGTEVRFEVDGSTVCIVRVEGDTRSRGQTLVQHMRGSGRTTMSTDDIMALTRGVE
jgi:bifunctional DNA-binding transcriptional regulator/antitoxin component of YhaV-PrlF toxin-antitoxin module